VKTVFFDVDTQNDFMLPAGALYVPGAERRLAAIARLNHHAKERGIALISTADAHAEDDPEFAQWPAHCVSGTFGQRKPYQTEVGQIVINKRTLDCFSNPELPGVLSRLGGERYVVYGVVTEYCVRLAAEGLLATGARVEVVTDAVETLKREEAERTYQALAARGGGLTTLDRVLA
jgi:nicotinamidase/pyrazinamidase